MEYVALKDLNISKNEVADKVVSYHGFEVVIKQHLGILDKIDLVATICKDVVSFNEDYYNTVELEGFFYVRTVLAYTNILISEDEGKTLGELYDILRDSDFHINIWAEIPEVERKEIFDYVKETLDNLYKYRNSAFGIMASISQNANNFDLDLQDLQKQLADTKNLDLVSEIVKKLG